MAKGVHYWQHVPVFVSLLVDHAHEAIIFYNSDQKIHVTGTIHFRKVQEMNLCLLCFIVLWCPYFPFAFAFGVSFNIAFALLPMLWLRMLLLLWSLYAPWISASILESVVVSVLQPTGP